MANQNTPSVSEQEQDSNTLRQIRLEKLRQRQADGNDPFTITKYDVTAKAASVKADYEVTEAKFKEEAGDDEEALQAKLDTLKEQPISIFPKLCSIRRRASSEKASPAKYVCRSGSGSSVCRYSITSGRSAACQRVCPSSLQTTHPACRSAFTAKPSPACIAAIKGQRSNVRRSSCAGKA